MPELPTPKKSLRERAERISYLIAILLGIPLLGGLAAWLNSEWSLTFTVLYLFFLHLFPLVWLEISFRGYTRAPSSEEVEKDTYKYPAQYSDKWQLLLFPAQIGAFQFEKSKTDFLKAGFRVWEGQLASLLCALALKPDLLDGFDEDWGIPIRYLEIMFQFGLSLFWSTVITILFLLNERLFCGILFLVLTILQSGAIAFFFLYEHYRMPKIELETHA